MSKLAEGNGYGRSLFERMQLLGLQTDLLDTQYRMHPSISHFPRNAFYGGKVRNASF